MMLHEDGLSKYGTDAAATCRSGDGDEEVDEKDHEIAPICIVTRNGKLAEFQTNWQFAMDRHADGVEALRDIHRLRPTVRGHHQHPKDGHTDQPRQHAAADCESHPQPHGCGRIRNSSQIDTPSVQGSFLPGGGVAELPLRRREEFSASLDRYPGPARGWWARK